MSTASICLLIDDDQDDQEIFTLALEDSGLNMQCVICHNASEALQRLIEDDTFLPNYIFLDLNMPRINGVQLLTEIKKISRLKHIPIVIYSTSSHPKDKEATHKLGAAAFITKPSGIKELSQILKDFFQTHLQPAYE
ncbi:response regulator [Emticicia sp. BO119]|uniref:response regulator n=1 Tax=Emticicia sp. BO119 TaxID=2757768 RepID=UPI0015EFF5BA|nr:response regulator [Emticicia sp. BO119]MBA4853826.1 response regulator [Emticicia sp. BO119]